ncbi:MAG TPA: SdpI family protein [Verrucomicrobiae bacterium]|nr:SdpI family protein [Verrucomicrobiae bacterium]
MTDQPFFVPSLLISVFAIPLVLGLIPRNRWYGIRTAQTLSDERVWYRSNRFAGWIFLFSGIIYLVIARMFPTARTSGSDFALWLLHLGAFVLPLAASVLLTMRYVKGLLKLH